MREKYKNRGFYTDLACGIIGLDPEPPHSWEEGPDTMAFSLLQFIIWVYGPGRDWESFLGLGDYIGRVIEEYRGTRDLLYEAFNRDIRNRAVSGIPADVVQGYQLYWQVVHTMAGYPEFTEMTKYNHYQYLHIIQERYNEKKRELYMQRNSAPQFQAAPETQGTAGQGYTATGADGEAAERK